MTLTLTSPQKTQLSDRDSPSVADRATRLPTVVVGWWVSFGDVPGFMGGWQPMPGVLRVSPERP